MVWRWCSKGTRDGVAVIVVNNSGDSSLLASVLGLGSKGAYSSLDEGDVASNSVREVRELATLVVDKNEIAMDWLLVLRGWSQTHWVS